MKKFEYKVTTQGQNGYYDNKSLDGWGNGGWELAAMYTGMFGSLHAVFKRELNELPNL